jgi:hypothetical protein
MQYHVVELGSLAGVPDDQKAFRLAPPAAIYIPVTRHETQPVPGASKPSPQLYRLLECKKSVHDP